jgi:Domain of unknown function (DUF4338)
MDAKFRYRGRKVTEPELEFIRELIAAHPGASRRELSARLCAAWDWVQPNGTPRDMVCRGLMLELHRAGHIQLPPVRWVNPNPFLVRRRPLPPLLDTTPLLAPLAQIQPLDFELVRRTGGESFFNGLLEHYHYLGYTQPVGEHLKYLVHSRRRPIACLAWSSAPRHLGSRDCFIGWSARARRQNIRFLAYNTRFLILPWVKVPHLASHLLGRVARQLPLDWERIYGHAVYLLETFVDPERFRGTCYRAANWILVGQTTGRGKAAPSKKPNRPIKQVWVLPLVQDFRQRLSEV